MFSHILKRLKLLHELLLLLSFLFGLSVFSFSFAFSPAAARLIPFFFGGRFLLAFFLQIGGLLDPLRFVLQRGV